ncbi:UPF0755 protein [Clostridium cavendishii DSM 21758]|uniref:Endolytic murein transglycosylase n=1 Tax=Clostridium cavendishii DSM 21758 TaxID=1121302 RepID=A0A1M6KEL6_9CLOT|nr:endolytic transglycosylase MltG [Clostridium cavendishii]SHJ57352.1 UPF0755 protein [Clostridium cavendishii DSM 21758]
MKKYFNLKIIIPIFVSLLLMISGIVYLKYIRTQNSPLISSQSTVKIVVKEGDSIYNLFDSLENENKLKSSFFAKLYIKNNKPKVEIKPGEYNVRTETSLKNLITLLTEGGDTLKVTIPEGFTVDEIATRLDKNGIVKKEEFLKACKEYKGKGYIKDTPGKKYLVEGFLFPDTYNFSKKVKSEDIIKEMIDRFEAVIKDIQIETNVEIKEEDYEKYANIASMIEKEARVDKDRELISSVIKNRLDKKMMLQICSTVIYALGEHKDKLYDKDLKIDSPYNTYKNYGLPVGPIGNAGKPSIKAAISPADTNYIYYILELDQKTHFFTNKSSEFENKKKERQNAGL